MKARVTVAHQGRKRGSVVEVDGRLRKEQGRLMNGWLVSLEPPPPPEKPSKRRKSRSRVEPSPRS